MPSRIEIHSQPRVYSWGAAVDFVLDSRGGFKDLDEPPLSLLWQQPYILRLDQRQIHPTQEGAGARGYRLTIYAEDTAGAAENLGTRLVVALLGVAIDRVWGLSLSWPDSPLPCRVLDRTASAGPSVTAFGSVTGLVTLDKFASELDRHFEKSAQPSYRRLLSMELCAASRMENSNRAKLIMLVSALEALAEQKDLSSQLSPLIANLKAAVQAHSFSEESLRDSIVNQIDRLRQESARRAILRLLREAGIVQDEIDFVEEAYSARSGIVHEGRRVPRLDSIVNRLDSVLRRLYQERS